jgi:hypothetical protein
MPETPEGGGRSAAWGVVAAVLGGGAFSTWIGAVSPGSKFPVWPAWVFSALTVAATYRCFASLPGGRPIGRGLRRRARRASATTPPPVSVMLIPEQAGARLHLGLLNTGATAEFSAQVTGILDTEDRAMGLQHWPIPWLEDDSTEPKRILTGQTRMLDFARYDVAAVNAELGTGHGGADHWRFSSIPAPIGVTYSMLRDQRDLEEQRFSVTVRIMDASSGNFTDRMLTIGVRGFSLLCEPA